MPGYAKSRIYAGKSTKWGFSKSVLTKIEKLFLFYDGVSRSNTWKGKLEVASFFCHLEIYTSSVKALL